MVVAGLCFVGVNGTVRALGTSLPAAQGAFIRFCFGLLLTGPMLWPALRRGFPADLWRLFLLRGVLHAGAVMLWFYAMARLSVAEVTAIGYLNPVITMIGAVLFLGERLSLRRTLCVLIAFAGALIVLRPGVRALVPAHLAQLGAAVGFGLSYLVAKSLAEKVPAAVVVGMMSLMVTLALMPFALWHWQTPHLGQVITLAVTAGFATAGHYAMTRAFAHAPMSVTQPITFLQLLWASLLGAVAFGEAIDPWVLVGGAVTLSAILFMTLTERHSRASAPPDRP